MRLSRSACRLMARTIADVGLAKASVHDSDTADMQRPGCETRRDDGKWLGSYRGRSNRKIFRSVSGDFGQMGRGHLRDREGCRARCLRDGSMRHHWREPSRARVRPQCTLVACVPERAERQRGDAPQALPYAGLGVVAYAVVIDEGLAKGDLRAICRGLP
ncbi:hypothetical protein BD626DRAFT_108602 [Schizophyllum amplum]|uniref:Uncharacterized protein n=1 Tax=Schizophyllum amplum TaxID=97359 RepID=A0A550CT45_9AGAR|nr:hypothetical protein BD626DRAFT_108602 [Auriculariopsis ampla]